MGGDLSAGVFGIGSPWLPSHNYEIVDLSIHRYLLYLVHKTQLLLCCTALTLNGVLIENVHATSTPQLVVYVF